MIDDTVENICAARSQGMHGLLVDNKIAKTGSTLRSLVQDPLPRAAVFLKDNARKHHCVIQGHQDLVLRDNFAQLMIWELTGDENIIYLKWPSGRVLGSHSGGFVNDRANGHTNGHINGHVNGHTNGHTNGHVNGHANGQTNDNANGNTNGITNGNNGVVGDSDLKNGLWNYFYEEPLLTSRDFPPNADTTSTAYLSLPSRYLPTVANVELVMDAMAKNVDSDGIMQTYFTDDRPRTTPEVCCNILRVFHRFGHGSDPRIKKTQDWIVKCVENDACHDGNRYYSTPESLLYFVARLRAECGSHPFSKELSVVKDKLEERINVPTNPLALALRLYSCQLVGIDPRLYKNDLKAFMSLQEQDGGWPAGHFCRIGRTGACIGNRGLTTALAAKIIRTESLSN